MNIWFKWWINNSKIMVCQQNNINCNPF